MIGSVGRPVRPGRRDPADLPGRQAEWPLEENGLDKEICRGFIVRTDGHELVIRGSMGIMRGLIVMMSVLVLLDRMEIDGRAGEKDVMLFKQMGRRQEDGRNVAEERRYPPGRSEGGP